MPRMVSIPESRLAAGACGEIRLSGMPATAVIVIARPFAEIRQGRVLPCWA